MSIQGKSGGERRVMRHGVFRLTVTDEFSSSHCLRHYEGPCEALHGHNFLVEAVFQGERLIAGTDMLMDFKDCKGLLRQILAKLDHRHLNDVPYFNRHNPTAENLARFIYWELAKLLEGKPAALAEVSVFEKSTSKATYYEIP